MRRTELAATRRILACWRQTLANANHLAAETDDAELLQGLAEVRDYLVDQIEVYERRLNITPVNAQFATLENSRDNRPETRG